MDLNMPIMDGYTASLEIQKLYLEKFPEGMYHDFSQLSIVAVTAYENEENVSNCYKIGMKEVLHKPVDQHKLKEVISDFFS